LRIIQVPAAKNLTPASWISIKDPQLPRIFMAGPLRRHRFGERAQ